MKHHRPGNHSSGVDSATQVNEAVRLVSELHEVGALPDSLHRILKIAEDPRSDARQLRAAILSDPAIALRVLRVVNSALCGMRGTVDSLDHAIRLLGFEAVKQLAAATSILPLFRDDQIHPRFNVRELLTHARAVATGTALLATATGTRSTESAYLAGLLHDAGILVAIRVRRKELADLIQRLDEEPDLSFRAAEREVLGTTHEALSEALCRRWRMPEPICHAARHHHRPGEAGCRLTALVLVADRLAARSGLGYSRTVETHEVPGALLRQLEIDLDTLAEVEGQIPEALDDFDRPQQGAA